MGTDDKELSVFDKFIEASKASSLDRDEVGGHMGNRESAGFEHIIANAKPKEDGKLDWNDGSQQASWGHITSSRANAAGGENANLNFFEDLEYGRDIESSSFWMVSMRWLNAVMREMSGTMFRASHVVQNKHFFVQFIDACLRGTSQVFLVNNPVCGMIILAAIGMDSWYTFVFAVTGLSSAVFASIALGLDKGARSNGLYGYNGVLVGIAVSLFSYGSRDDADWAYLVPAILMGAFSTVIFAACGSVTVRLLGMAPFTLPFQLTTWLWMLSAQAAYSSFPLESPTPSLQSLVPETQGALEVDVWENRSAGGLFRAIFRGVAQVFLVGNWGSGLLMTIGLAVSSPIVALAAVGGSAIGTFFSLAMGVSAPTISAGLAGEPL
jgi:urea transporter